MSEAGNKSLPVTAEALPQPPVFGKPKKDLERTVLGFARRLRNEYRECLLSDQAARKFKKRVVSILRRNLPPFAGRPPEEPVTHAIQLCKAGAAWKQVCPEVIPGYPNLDPLRSRQAESNLRAAVRSRRNARRQRRLGKRYLLTAGPQPSRPASAPTGPSAAGASGAGG
jgi:hypothetical protein